MHKSVIPKGKAHASIDSQEALVLAGSALAGGVLKVVIAVVNQLIPAPASAVPQNSVDKVEPMTLLFFGRADKIGAETGGLFVCLLIKL